MRKKLRRTRERDEHQSKRRAAAILPRINAVVLDRKHAIVKNFILSLIINQNDFLLSCLYF